MAQPEVQEVLAVSRSQEQVPVIVEEEEKQ